VRRAGSSRSLAADDHQGEVVGWRIVADEGRDAIDDDVQDLVS
jgi:hypothetical protein